MAAPPSPMPPAEPDQPRPRSSRSLHPPDDANHSFEDDTEDESKAIVELAVIMTASTPVTPGPSSPPLDQHRNQDLPPPTRPSSTPFLHAEPRNDDIQYARTPADPQDVSHDLSMQSTAVPPSPCEAEPPAQGLETLPLEIHESILDHLFGYRVSPTSKSSLAVPRATTSISAMLRHSRRRELSQLALVNKLWRATVQQRLFRHIRVKASNEELEKAMTFFIEHPHLRDCVKHIEVWFPVFHPKLSTPPFGTPNMALPTMTDTGFAMTSYTLPPDNCTLDEVFYFVGTTFPDVQVLTLEGGDRRKAPKVKVFRHPHIQQHLPVIKSVKTLVTKGQWNLIRSEEDFSTIVTALTCLQEWHGQYSKPKSKGYLTMSPVLQRLPSHLKRLHLMLEADYRRELAFPAFFLKVMAQVHFCSPLAEAVSKLEHLSYTGRVCHNFFDLAARKADSRTTILRSVDITVRNCCRKVTQLHDAGSGITDMSFINAFEALVLSAIRSMEKLTKLNFVKLRYVDLESPVPSLNPFFEIRNGKCYGVWSDKIVTELNRVRPNVEFAELNDSFGPIGQFKDGRMVISPDFPRTRITSLKLGNYAMLQGATIATNT